MSTATEIANREATAAEGEHPDEEEAAHEEEPEEEEPDADQPPAQAPEPVTEAMLKKIGEKIAAEDTRHEKRLHEIYGDLFEGRQPCPLCLQEGFILPAEPGEFDPQQALAVEAAMGHLNAPEYREHPQEVRCEECDGWGEMLNGSRREGMGLSACQQCMGTGHMPKPIAQPQNGAPLAPPQWTPPAPPYDPAMVNRDQWGRDPGNPYFGQDPALNGGIWS